MSVELTSQLNLYSINPVPHSSELFVPTALTANNLSSVLLIVVSSSNSSKILLSKYPDETNVFIFK